MKTVLILLDGLGDRSWKELKNQTPLQAARTPFLDRLAKNGSSGLYHAGLSGEAMPSELAHLLLFGFEREEYPGRGALEALGADIPLRPDESAFLCHLASADIRENNVFLAESRPPAEKHETRELFAALQQEANKEADFLLHQTGIHDGVLIIRGPSSPHVTDSDTLTAGSPLAAVVPLTHWKNDPVTRTSAERLSRFISASIEILSRHPVNLKRREQGLLPLNILLTQRGGRAESITPFRDRFGLTGCSIASGTVYQGIARYTGLEFFKMSDTANPGSDLEKRLKLSRELLKSHDFIHLHTKAPDAAAHKKDPLLKKTTIENIDKALSRELPAILADPDIHVVVTADHSTPSGGPLIHSGEPVPLVIHGKNVRLDRVKRFNEIDAAGGSLGSLRGKELMLTLLNLMDRCRTLGFKEDPDEPLFWPGNFKNMKGSDGP